MKKQGFTLIELLVVVAIISLISSVVVAGLNQARSKARDAKRVADIKALEQALELYRNDHGSYPSTLGKCNNSWCFGCANPQGLTIAMPQMVTGNYISALPVDPRPTPGAGLCFNYEYVSLPGQTTSSNQWYWTCDGRRTNQVQYMLRFQLENPRSGLSRFGGTNPGNGTWSGRANDYCIIK